jgi:hypothetical protein
MDNFDLKMSTAEQRERMEAEDSASINEAEAEVLGNRGGKIETVRMPDGLASIATWCMHCNTRGRLRVDPRDYRRWIAGALIQNAMPYLTADERELLISNTCAECWKKIFATEEEDDS